MAASEFGKTLIHIAAAAVVGAVGASFFVAWIVTAESAFQAIIRENVYIPVMWRGALLGAAAAVFWKTR